MAKGSLIATCLAIKNQETLDALAKLTGPAIGGVVGRIVARGKPTKAAKEGLDLHTVIIEFERRGRCESRAERVG
jgi:hypothetical protein